MAGLQSLSSSRIERHTVPEGYTFGWKSGGSNLPEIKEFLEKEENNSSVHQFTYILEEMKDSHPWITYGVWKDLLPMVSVEKYLEFQ